MSALGFGAGTGVLHMRKITARQRERMERRQVRAWKFRNFFRQGWRELPLELYLFLFPVLRVLIPGLNVSYGTCYLRRYDSATGRWVDYGKVGRHLKTTAGKNYIASCFNNVAEPENLKFHGFGTGTTAAAAGDTTLQTELTTQYNPDSTRPTGTQANSTNTYTTVGTVTPDAAVAITEWGLFSASSSGTLFDRQVFSAVNLNGTGDSLQMTYVYTEN